MITKIEDLRKASDEEVLKCYAEAQGRTRDFQEYFKTDYSYGLIGAELQSRGYIQGWHKPTKEIKVKFSKDNERMNLNMTKECKQRFEKFLEDKAYNFVHTTAAITNYLDAVEKKEIKVSVEVV